MALGALRQWVAPIRGLIHRKRWVLIPVFVLIVAGAVYGAFSYDNWRQNKAYEEWLAGSSVHADPVAGTESTHAVDLLEPTDTPADNQDDKNDPRAAFIRKYYADIGNGRLADAYAVSKKSVSFDTFRSWYAHTTNVQIDSLQPIDATTYSLALTLTDTDAVTRYAVRMEVGGDLENGFVVAASEVRVITVTNAKTTSVATPVSDGENVQSTQPLAITNEEFASVLASGDAFVLDAREDEENAYGRLPGSTHVRFADLVAGDWISLPTDRAVYVLCWSGIRGKEVAEFLRSKDIQARYLESGADGWVKDGGKWEGAIAFQTAYPEERYRIVLDKKQVQKAIENGTVLVDSRPRAAYDAWHIPGSYSFPVIYTPSAKLPEVMAAIPRTASIITVCDDFVSCFDARIGGIKLEHEGHVFLGRFASPWEFK